MQRQLMTTTGHISLQEELSKLKTQDRPKIIQDISEARSHGDLKENAEYHAAREHQVFLENRIRDLEQKIASSEVINPANLALNGKVLFGMNVEVEDCKTKKKYKYQIVGEEESSIEHSRLSYLSPIGKALIGKAIDEKFLVDVPGGQQALKVLKVYL